MDRLKDAVENVIRQLSEGKSQGLDAQPQEWLKKALTKRELGHIKFHYFRNGVLGLRVDSSVWKYNFSLHRDKLLLKIHQHAPQVRDLRFSVGDIE